jgi:glycine cleavage system H protein
MVAILVVATILLFLGVELLRKRTIRQKTVAAPSEHIAIPKGYFISKAHTWVEVMFSGEARIGIDDFVQKIIGTVETIDAVPAGTEVKRGETIMTLHHGTKSLTVPVPISGKVTQVNQQALASPQFVNTDPYIGGWIALIAPTNISAEIKLLSIAEDAANWFKKEISRFRDFIKAQAPTGTLAPAGVTMLDGGMPLSGALEHCPEKTWQAFQQEFLSAK